MVPSRELLRFRPPLQLGSAGAYRGDEAVLHALPIGLVYSVAIEVLLLPLPDRSRQQQQ